MKTWDIKYEGHEIRVETGISPVNGLSWMVKRKMRIKALRSAADCGEKIGNGEGAGETIKVSLGGWFVVGCSVFVDEKMIDSGKGQFRFQ